MDLVDEAFAPRFDPNWKEYFSVDTLPKNLNYVWGGLGEEGQPPFKMQRGFDPLACKVLENSTHWDEVPTLPSVPEQHRRHAFLPRAVPCLLDAQYADTPLGKNRPVSCLRMLSPLCAARTLCILSQKPGSRRCVNAPTRASSKVPMKDPQAPSRSSCPTI